MITPKPAAPIKKAEPAEQKPLTSVEMYEKAKKLNEAGQKEEAKRILREIIEIYPGSEAAKIATKLLG